MGGFILFILLVIVAGWLTVKVRGPNAFSGSSQRKLNGDFWVLIIFIFGGLILYAWLTYSPSSPPDETDQNKSQDVQISPHEASVKKSNFTNAPLPQTSAVGLSDKNTADNQKGRAEISDMSFVVAMIVIIGILLPCYILLVFWVKKKYSYMLGSQALSEVTKCISRKTSEVADEGDNPNSQQDNLKSNGFLNTFFNTTVDVLQQSFAIVKQKFNEGGRKRKTVEFGKSVRAGFVSDENTVGIKRLASRFINLWKSGKAGKTTLIAVVVSIALLIIFGILKTQTGCVIKSIHEDEISKGVNNNSIPPHQSSIKSNEIPQVLNIHGLTLGMAIDDSIKILKDLIPKKDDIYIEEKQGLQEESKVFIDLAGASLSSIIHISKEKRVLGLFFEPTLTNLLLGITAESSDEYAQQFSSKYGLPSMEKEIRTYENALHIEGNPWTGNSSAETEIWTYSSPHGWTIEIAYDKSLNLWTHNMAVSYE